MPPPLASSPALPDKTPARRQSRDGWGICGAQVAARCAAPARCTNRHSECRLHRYTGLQRRRRHAPLLLSALGRHPRWPPPAVDHCRSPAAHREGMIETYARADADADREPDNSPSTLATSFLNECPVDNPKTNHTNATEPAAKMVSPTSRSQRN